MYYFLFLTLAKHISPFKPQQKTAVVSISTFVQTIVFQMCSFGHPLSVYEDDIDIIYQCPVHKIYFGKYKPLMASFLGFSQFSKVVTKRSL